MPASVTSVHFMYNDWTDEVDHTMDVIGLYVDFDNPANPYSHGRRWAELLSNRQRPLVALLGYGAGKEAAPSPRGGKGHQTGNLIARRMAQAMAGGLAYKDYAAKWIEVNRDAGIFTAVGIDVWSGYRNALNPDRPRQP